MTVFKDCVKTNSLIYNLNQVLNKFISNSVFNIFTVFLTITSFEFVTNLSIVNLFDLAINKLVIFFGFNLIIFNFDNLIIA